MRPERIECGVFATALNEHPNDRQRAVLTLVNEVHLHSKRLASHGMFARCVEMEL